MKLKLFSKKGLARLASLLGFSGVTFLSSCGPEMLSAMYGTPAVEYTVKGRVISPSSEPIQGIRVVVADPDGYSPADTLYTDVNGLFVKEVTSTFGFDKSSLDSIVMSFSDIDGAENGEWVEKEVLLGTFDFEQVQEDDTWFGGGYEFTGEVVLEEKRQ